MEEKIIQIIPAPANLMYSYGGEDANHVVWHKENLLSKKTEA